MFLLGPGADLVYSASEPVGAAGCPDASRCVPDGTPGRALFASGLRDAGGRGVRVGAADRSPGREPAAVIVPTAASSARGPRGTELLLFPHRIDVSASRGQCCAVVVRSPGPTDQPPATSEGLRAVGRYVGLCRRGTSGELP